MPLLDHLLAQLEVTVHAALGSALVAAYDGTLVQCLIEDEDEDDAGAARLRRAELFTVLVEHYTRTMHPRQQLTARTTYEDPKEHKSSRRDTRRLR